ncbi:hypothetical protein BP6252_08059 [Coleophoma cylindrospora]|uniref:Uncharacterized protein n=1 Tax=Coleophoma cylindrospora TaxID=1849047 RepID=A0A3D8RC09_9HELO|nr:hypothetical protein BP6252_08059 [Coleophoma cylindrospora]
MSSAATSYPEAAGQQLSSSFDMGCNFDITSYARTMHQHTKKQMEAASKSARRRSPQTNTSQSVLSPQTSISSMESRSSQ